MELLELLGDLIAEECELKEAGEASEIGEAELGETEKCTGRGVLPGRELGLRTWPEGELGLRA